jgi:hypothetical protein
LLIEISSIDEILKLDNQRTWIMNCQNYKIFIELGNADNTQNSIFLLEPNWTLKFYTVHKQHKFSNLLKNRISIFNHLQTGNTTRSITKIANIFLDNIRYRRVGNWISKYDLQLMVIYKWRKFQTIWNKYTDRLLILISLIEKPSVHTDLSQL